LCECQSTDNLAMIFIESYQDNNKETIITVDVNEHISPSETLLHVRWQQSWGRESNHFESIV